MGLLRNGCSSGHFFALNNNEIENPVKLIEDFNLCLYKWKSIRDKDIKWQLLGMFLHYLFTFNLQIFICE